MDYQEATEASVSIYEAIRELKNHGFKAIFDGRYIICEISGERIAKPFIADQVWGGDVLAWLGY